MTSPANGPPSSPQEGLAEARRKALEGRHPRWEPRSIAGCFDAVASEHPQRPYVITDEGAFTYAQMQQWSRQLGRGLISLGVGVGEHVAMVVDNRPEFVTVKLAIARVGAVAVPLNYQYRIEELRGVLAHSEASVLITMGFSASGANFVEALDELIGPGWERGVSSPEFPRL